MTAPLPPPHPLPVYRAEDFCVTFGANEGDALSVARDLVLDDIYERGRAARPAAIGLLPARRGRFRIADSTGTGTPGALVQIECTLGFTCPNGHLHEALLLIERGGSGRAEQVYLSPLHSFAPKTPYQLMLIDRDSPREIFARLGSASFLRGTRITLPTGAQLPIERLRAGDLVLTRDDGPRPLRWVGQTTLRATGAWAPVRIAAGALHNSADLVLSAGHRLFFYQRRDELAAGRPEVMVRVQDLVGSPSVTRLAGGHVDVFHLVFDSHQIIFAEGIAAESMLVDQRSRPLVPPEVAARALGGDAVAGFEVGGQLQGHRDPVSLLRDAIAG